jgi:hypothetical protein
MRSYKKDHHNKRRIRYGWRISASGYHMVDQAQQKVISEIFKLRSNGLILQAICDHLNNNGIETPRNGKWHCSTIKKILDQNSPSFPNKK